MEKTRIYTRADVRWQMVYSPGMDLAHFVLGQSRQLFSLSGLEALQFHACRMAAQARRRLIIASHHLDDRIHGRSCFIEAVRQLAIRHPFTRIEILVGDTQRLARQGSRLLPLAQDLASSVSIRCRDSEDENDERSFLLVDDCGYLLRNRWHDLRDIQGDYDNRGRVRRLEREFRRMWERSHEDPALRRLHL